jgi:hypothetical protein
MIGAVNLGGKNEITISLQELRSTISFRQASNVQRWRMLQLLVRELLDDRTATRWAKAEGTSDESLPGMWEIKEPSVPRPLRVQGVSVPEVRRLARYEG